MTVCVFILHGEVFLDRDLCGVRLVYINNDKYLFYL